MSVISEVKCGRCDRKYSGFRSRCPYCGARRSKRGKHADEADNAKAKLVIGIVLLVVLIGAVMVLIITSLPNPDETDEQAGVSDPSPGMTDSEAGNTTLVTEDTSPSPSPSPSPSAVIEVAAVFIFWTNDGYDRTDVTMDYIGQTFVFDFRTVPETDDADREDMEVVWESSDEEIFMVVDGSVTAISPGSATLSCTVDGVEATCVIRVPNKTA